MRMHCGAWRRLWFRLELVEEDRQVEEHICHDIAEQKAKGLHYHVDETLPVEERAARMKEKLRQRLAELGVNNKEKLRQRLAEQGEENVGNLTP
jgi:hypothetical protein